MSGFTEVLWSEKIGKKFAANTGAGLFIGTVGAIYSRNDGSTLIYPTILVPDVPALQVFDAKDVSFLG